MRSQLAVLIAAVSSIALAGCDDSINCGDRFVYDETRMRCACGPDLVEIEGGACMLPDGGVIIPPGFDAGPPRDAQTPDDAPTTPDGGTDAVVDACTETVFYRDVDMDSFGDPSMVITTCGEAPAGYVENDDDCDDSCAECQPDGTEVCDGLDNNCNGATDEGVLDTFFRDADMDGFGHPTMPTQACTAPTGFVDNDGDCNDACMTCRPGGTEVCEGTLDEDCSMGVDNGCTCTIGATRACPGGSDVGQCLAGEQTCSGAGEWGGCLGSIGPTAETCNSFDDDCDAVVDGPTAAASCGTASRANGVGCSAGTCVITTCSVGYGDCDSAFANGCEATFGTLAHCASCGDSCGWACQGTSCNDATLVNAGGGHTCALRENGDAVCWGSNTAGELGDGTMTDRTTAVPVGGLASGVTTLATGGSHTCARLSSGGALRCWGSNNYGQLGDGSTTNRTAPVAVTGLSSGPTAIVAGASHTCALLATGTVRCWGYNARGQLGDASTTNRTTPVTVAGLSAVTEITAGQNHTCALLSTGAVRCWGFNNAGQLGDGSTMNRSSPVPVSGLSGVAAIAAGGSHTCALLSTGAVRCWGSNASGQLGDSSTTPRMAPVAVVGLSGVAGITGGLSHTCALLSTGGALCWGNNGYGQLGNGSTTNSTTPVSVTGLSSGVAAITAGGLHACGRLTSGAVVCWGNNTYGRLGDGSVTNRTTPVAVTAP